MDACDPDLSRGAGVAVSHVGGTLFMTGQDKFDVGSGRNQGVKNRYGRPAGIAEYVLHAVLFQHSDQRLSTV
jgi:hypothetical protein